ncbi:MAG TPA: GntR family transcriptional regulator [Jatrophihabitans sp.]|jgi:GntR family transcriptional regulator|nr:GntR family transcriptional regulator [Jatrophihabitans sp.]
MRPRESGEATAVAEAYRKLSQSLRRRQFTAGSRLPGERELAVQVGVSRSTLRQALAQLAEEGLLNRSAQRGWFVPREAVGEPPSTLQSFSEMARARGLSPGARVLSQRVRPATFDEARRLRIAPAAKVVELRRLRTMDAVPVCVDTSAVILARVPEIAQLDMTDRSLYDTIEEHSDVRIARSAYTVRADSCDATTAELLEIDPGSPILVGDEVTFDRKGVPVLAGTMSYRADAYRFEADLYRSA